MKLRDLFSALDAKSDLKNTDLTDIHIWLTSDDLEALGLTVTLESVWRDSGIRDWFYRIDAENPSIPAQRHIHVSREKHTTAKNMQASWNIDGTRHDRKSFNTSVGDQERVKRIARDALGLPSDFALESVDGVSSPLRLFEDVSISPDGKTAYLELSFVK